MPASSSSSQRPSTKRERERISLFPLLAVYFPRERMSQMLPSSSTGTRQKERMKKNTHTKEREREKRSEKSERTSSVVHHFSRESTGVCGVVCAFFLREKNLVVCLFVLTLQGTSFSLFFSKGDSLKNISFQLTPFKRALRFKQSTRSSRNKTLINIRDREK